MANEKDINVLTKGISLWNQWRKENPSIQPDFREANLSGVDLHGADLHGANLCYADLRGANLSKAYLYSAKLFRVDLRDAHLTSADLDLADFPGANLGRARLDNAHLIGVDLRGANLRDADLAHANLSRASLRGADLTAAIVAYTWFGDVDLREVRGLETVKHYGPSSIGIDTVYRSEGNVPEVFLRGAGVPENFIEYMHSLAGRAFEYYSCFISYSSKDEAFANRIYADLQAKGIRCWFAPEDLKIGDKFHQRIDEAVRFYDKLLVVLSESSVNSTWVESEVEAAFEKEGAQEGKLVLFPIRLDNAVMETVQAWAADIRRKRHIGDFSNWKDHNSYQKAFQRLLRDLQGEKGGEALSK